jgi:hypothetical protein
MCASITSEGIESMILFFLSIKRRFGKYLVVWTILRKNDNETVEKVRILRTEIVSL